MVIAIDGTSGSGKSTVARRVAESTAFRLLNTGLIYRAITRACLDRNIGVDEVPAIVDQARRVSLGPEDGSLHGEEVSQKVPFYAQIPEVRAEVRRLQQRLGRQQDAVIEGRDIGTVVFPDAEFKFFITASLDERARRRQKQLGAPDEAFQTIRQNLDDRDHQDEHRVSSPLVPAVDALLVDTTSLTLDQVVETLLATIRGRRIG